MKIAINPQVVTKNTSDPVQLTGQFDEPVEFEDEELEELEFCFYVERRVWQQTRTYVTVYQDSDGQLYRNADRTQPIEDIRDLDDEVENDSEYNDWDSNDEGEDYDVYNVEEC